MRDLITREARVSPLPPIDERLIHSMARGMPACAGVAVGMDRLLMAMIGSDRIADVLAFEFSRA